MANEFISPRQMRADIITTFSINARACGVPETDIAKLAPVLADAWMHSPMRADLERLIPSFIAPISPHDALRQLMDAVDALRDRDADRDRARAKVIDAATAFVAMSRGQFATPQPRENR